MHVAAPRSEVARTSVLLLATLALIATLLPAGAGPAWADEPFLAPEFFSEPFGERGATFTAIFDATPPNRPASGLYAEFEVVDDDPARARTVLQRQGEVVGPDGTIAIDVDGDPGPGIEVLAVELSVYEDESRATLIDRWELELRLGGDTGGPGSGVPDTDLPPLGVELDWTPAVGGAAATLTVVVTNLLDGSPAARRFVDVQGYDTSSYEQQGPIERAFITSRSLSADGSLTLEIHPSRVAGIDELEVMVDIWTSPTRDVTAGYFGNILSAQRAMSVGTPTLSDVAGSTHEENIWRLVTDNITSGFADGTFRPDATVERGQFATFLYRGLTPEPGDLDAVTLTDITGTTHEFGIRWIVSAGVVGGFADGTFRPSAPVNRGQMATFIANTLDLPDAPSSELSDIAGTTHEASVDKLVAAGIAGGFGDGSYRPDAPVQRGQMATFLVRARQWQMEQHLN